MLVLLFCRLLFPVALLLPVIIGRILLLLLALPEQRFYSSLVENRIFHVRLQSDCFIVGLYRFPVLTEPGQCIASVVGRICAVEPVKLVQRLPVIAPLVGGTSEQGRVLRNIDNPLVLLLLQGFCCLLVGALPEIAPFEGHDIA